jgi:HSP20 family protein
MPISDLLPWNREKEKYALQKRDEFDPLDMQREMNQMIETFFEAPFTPAHMRRWLDEDTSFTPRVDVSESETEISIRADLPGMEEKDIHLTVESNTLTISGEKQMEKEEKERTFHRVERRFGSFTRTIGLPESMDYERIHASFKNGVLTVKIPKPESTVTQRKRIPIKAG